MHRYRASHRHSGRCRKTARINNTQKYPGLAAGAMC
jgi:hypothetical protein